MGLALLLACGAALVSSEDPEVFAQEEEQEKPNIVYILADDARYEDLMIQEGISDLAARGALFTDYHLTNPLCCPARATYLTGQYAHSHGIMDNEHKGEQGWYWFKKKGHAADSLAVWMKQAGYQNAIFGKLMNGYTDEMRTPPGFERAYITDGPPGDGEATKRAQQFFAENADEGPVGVFLWLRSPHGPFASPKLYDGDFNHLQRELPASYAEADVSEKLPIFSELKKPGEDGMRELWLTRLEMAKRVDAGLLAMEEVARQTGEYDSTIFVITSDNGFFMGEHRLRNGKSHAYDAASHVPLIMSGPGVIPGRYAEVAGNHDVVPTVLELAGLPVPERVEGRNLFDPLSSGRDGILIENPSPGVYISRDRRPTLPGYKAVRTDSGELYIKWNNGHTEYYTNPDQTEASEPPPYMSEWVAELASCRGSSSCAEAERR